MGQRLKMLFNSGKNPKWKYYAAAALRNAVPAPLYRLRLEPLLKEAVARPDINEILTRVNYYCRDFNTDISFIPEERIAENPMLQQFRQATVGTLKPTRNKVYYNDTVEFSRLFPSGLRLNLLPGDITFEPPVPSIVKSRPIDDGSLNSVLFKLDKVRHFINFNDTTSFSAKKKEILFRGKIAGKPNRILFMEKFFGRPGFNVGAVDRSLENIEWIYPKLTLGEQLRSGIVMALEGNDVASNLKWLMGSQSLVFTPRMRFESWFMEGTLKPGFHYVEVADDFSDVEEKADFYFSHPGEAEKIIRNANIYAESFRDKRRENLTEVLTMGKYLSRMNPKVEIPLLTSLLGSD